MVYVLQVYAYKYVYMFLFVKLLFYFLFFCFIFVVAIVVLLVSHDFRSMKCHEFDVNINLSSPNSFPIHEMSFEILLEK